MGPKSLEGQTLPKAHDEGTKVTILHGRVTWWCDSERSGPGRSRTGRREERTSLGSCRLAALDP